jgi:hypothetical protein
MLGFRGPDVSNARRAGESAERRGRAVGSGFRSCDVGAAWMRRSAQGQPCRRQRTRDDPLPRPMAGQVDRMSLGARECMRMILVMWTTFRKWRVRDVRAQTHIFSRRVVSMLRSALVALTCCTAPLSAQAVAGTWNAEMETPGGSRAFRVMLAQTGDKLTGTVERPTGTVPLEGTVRGDSVFFTYVISYGGNPLTMGVRARRDGDAMSGSVNIGGQMDAGFKATKAAAGAPPE